MLHTVLVQNSVGTRLAVTVNAGQSDAVTCNRALTRADRDRPGEGWRAVTVLDREPLHWFERVVTLSGS
jgi:hypothetical protein